MSRKKTEKIMKFLVWEKNLQSGRTDKDEK